MTSDFEKYISSELTYDSEIYNEYHGANYPVGRILDVKIYFEHYSNWKEANDIWKRRIGRINPDNLFFEMTCFAWGSGLYENIIATTFTSLETS